MIATIARHTFTEAVRDGRFRVAAGLVVILVTLSGLLGWQAVRALEREAAGASNAERSRWLG
ncbi:MAG TPA: hypothetical protein PKX00_22510, partial [Opitutaceae bacterium]|nr:hypothetical protein [Opitutaceae bacterium]